MTLPEVPKPDTSTYVMPGVTRQILSSGFREDGDYFGVDIYTDSRPCKQTNRAQRRLK